MPANPKLSSEVHPGTKNFLLVLYQLQILYPPKRDHPLGDPLAVLFEYLFVLYSDFFFLLRKKGFIPRRGSYWNAPLWGPIWGSFSFISNPKKSFLTFNLHEVSAHFWYWRMEGTIDGGRVGPFFFFAHILKTIWYFFLIVSGSLKRWFSTYFGIFSEKKKRNVIFFKKNRRNQTSLFHEKFYTYFSNFSKTTQYFLLTVFVSIRRVA